MKKINIRTLMSLAAASAACMALEGTLSADMPPQAAATAQAMTPDEQAFANKLSASAQAMFNKMSKEQRQMAMRMATQACKGMNSCKGKGGCKTAEHACKGQNACAGKGGCKMDGEKATEMVQKHMAEKRQVLL